MVAVAWLKARKKCMIPALLPGLFMTFIVTTYIFWISPAHGGPVGFGLPLRVAYAIGVVLAVLFAAFAYYRGARQARENPDLAIHG